MLIVKDLIGTYKNKYDVIYTLKIGADHETMRFKRSKKSIDTLIEEFGDKEVFSWLQSLTSDGYVVTMWID